MHHLVHNPAFMKGETAVGEHIQKGVLNFCNAEAIDSIAATKESNTNLLFYNFNAYGTKQQENKVSRGSSRNKSAIEHTESEDDLNEGDVIINTYRKGEN